MIVFPVICSKMKALLHVVRREFARSASVRIGIFFGGFMKNGKDKVTHPDKQKVRDWLKLHNDHDKPLPSPEQVREELGWSLIQKPYDHYKT